MDGNGRWAKSRGHNRTWGHIRGARIAREAIQFCAQKNISHLSLFAFSTENWNRPKPEVNFLMKLLGRNLKKELHILNKNNIKFHCIGNLDNLPKSTYDSIRYTEQQTSENTGMKLIFAVSYSGKQDLLNATQKISQKVLTGELLADQINEDCITRHLSTSPFPDPDLIIRTSGEFRISNFFLWQAAYSEFFFTPTMWPDFTNKDLQLALDHYSQKQRRFGNIAPTTQPVTQ